MQATATKEEHDIDAEEYDKIKDQIADLIDGKEALLILSLLSHLIGEVGVNCGVELSSVIKATSLSIVHVYASQLPDDDEPIH